MRSVFIRSSIGPVVAIALGAAMLPLRSHLAIATAALVFVIPVVAGVAAGGWLGGLTSTFAGFVVYDFAFIPPYYTLNVDTLQDWVALGVYCVVMVIVARLVTHLHAAEEAANSRALTAGHLLDLSEVLLTNAPSLGQAVVNVVRNAFAIEGVALLQSVNGHLNVVASAGTPITAAELSRIQPESQLPVPLSTGSSAKDIQTLALAASGRPIGLLALRNTPTTPAVREALPLLANQFAIALERGELSEQAHRAQLLEEIDALRQALVGAVSHDLRTPLATIKVASSTLVASSNSLEPDEVGELYELIDMQTDRLSRLVNNLLDMTRIESGTFEVRRRPTDLQALIAEIKDSMHSILGTRDVIVHLPTDLNNIDADPLLLGQVLANLIDNADRHAPLDTPIMIDVWAHDAGGVAISVADLGSGVPEDERTAVFETFVRFDTGGRSGLGLAIAKAFTEAHGGSIWVEDGDEGGAKFVFTLPEAHSGSTP